MKQTVSLVEFRDAFRDAGRGDQFSYDGLKALYDFLDEDYELDVIALCCDFVEYDDVEEYADAYGLPYDTCPHCGDSMDVHESNTCPECEQSTIDEDAIMEQINNDTVHIPVANDSFIIMQY